MGQRIIFIIALVFCISKNSVSFAQKETTVEPSFSVVNKLLFGYNQFFSDHSDTLTFKDRDIHMHKDFQAYNGYIGVETQVLSWLSVVNIFNAGKINYKDKSNTPNLYYEHAPITIQEYSFKDVIPTGLFFSYSPAVRFYLGVPYVFIDWGIDLSLYQFKKYQFVMAILPDGSHGHIFLFQKQGYNFHVGGKLSFGVSIPLGGRVFLDSSLFATSNLISGLTSPKQTDPLGNGTAKRKADPLFTWGFTVGLKVNL